MKHMKSVFCVLAVILIAAPSFAHAHDPCNIDIEHGIQVNKARIRVFDKDKTLFEIDKKGRLWIEGESVPLNSKQQQLTTAYYQEVQVVVPQIIEMATSIVELTSEILPRSFAEAFGKDSGIAESIDALMMTVQKSIAQSMWKKGDEYRIAANGDQALDDAFGDKFEEEIEDIVEQALGSILLTVAKSIFNDEGDFEDQMEAFGEKIETSVERDLEDIEDKIEISAQRICRRTEALSQLEAQMRREIPSFAPYVVFK